MTSFIRCDIILFMNTVFENIIISDIIVCCDIRTAPQEKRIIKNRSSHGLIFSTCGKVNYFHGNKRFYTDPTHLLFIPAGISYSLEGEREDVSYVLNFKCNIPFDEILQLEMPGPDTLDDAEKAVEIFNQKYFYWQTSVRAQLYRIFVSLYQKNTNIPPKHIINCIMFLQSNLGNPELSNDMIAQHANISTIYLQKEFIRYFGISPHRYLQNLRISRAKNLLISHQMSITEICFATGYTSVYHFSRMFKRLTGLSPSAYRKKNIYAL